MKIFKIFSRKGISTNYDSLTSAEKRRIMEGALRTANKEQFELIKAYRENCPQPHN